jgi:asparagine synthase (glutamine-hydrolysing)
MTISLNICIGNLKTIQHILVEMCGIFSLVNIKNKNLDVVKLFQDFANLKHRGPDNSYFETYNNVIIGFHRLAIMDDTFSSNQPFIIEDENRTVIFICNGEIYNFREIIEKYNLPNSKNDCMVIPMAYMDMLKQDCEESFNRFIREEVKGEFAFVLFEFDRLKNLSNVIVARDEIGVRPLYYTPDSTDILFFSSEVKGGISQPHRVVEFPPGHIFNYELDELGNLACDKYDFSTVYGTEVKKYKDDDHLSIVQQAVLNSIRRRLCADKPLGFLLSGGVDSSLVAAISAKILGKPIRTFCCGIRSESGEGIGTDLAYARMVAKHIGSQHTEVLFTPEEALAVIPDVIRTIESWDTTSIRASIGQYLVCKWIGENTDCRVLLVGEGPDEVCSSYLFNWYAPNGEALDTCAKEYVKNIHYYDVKRADRCISKWGLEGRVPLLDPEFIKAYWSIPGEKRMPSYKGIEKWFLRKAFDGTDVLPNDVLFRTKEAFSDAVSSREKSLFSIIQEFVEDEVGNEELADAPQKYPYSTPQTKEAYYYRKIFCDIFGEERQDIIPHFWQPKWTAGGREVTQYIDPSARTLSIYNSLAKI